MTSRKPILAVVFALGLGAASTVTPRTVHAQSDDELKQARELFQEAYKDEQEKRYAEALEKFRRVARVKESPSVRYRIAAVLEAMGKLREARDNYRALAAQKDGLPPKDQPIAESAAVKAAEVDKKIPKIVVTISGEKPPADAKVTVDGVPVPTGRAVEQDPGERVVQANATGMKPYEQRVTLPDNGSQIPATVTFEPEGKGPDVTNPNPNPDHEGEGGGSRNKTLGVVALAAGGVLLVTGIGLLVAREGDIKDIKKLCPNVNACPSANEPAVKSDQDQANLFLPLGIAFSVVGAAAAGFGVYTLVKKPSGGGETAPPPSNGTSAHVELAPRYIRGGGMLGLSGTF